MFDPDREKPSADYLLRATAIMNSMAAGVTLVSELPYATALPITTIIRTAAILVDDHVIEANREGDDIRLSMRIRMTPPQNWS